MSEYTPTTRTYGHGSITFTHYPSSQRIAVVQTGENAVMDTSDLYRFMEDAGLLAEVECVAAEKAYERGRLDEQHDCNRLQEYREGRLTEAQLRNNLRSRNPYRKEQTDDRY